MAKTFETGDRVMFAAQFLRNTGQFTGWAPFARGTVVEVQPSGASQFVTVDWDAAVEEPARRSMALSSNLVRADRIHLEAR